jgi:hypothetical protein
MVGFQPPSSKPLVLRALETLLVSALWERQFVDNQPF